MKFNQGWRIFWCEECGERWESASRDRASPSGEDCQRCGEWVFPHDSRPDDSLAVDEFGNLTKSYDRVNCAIGTDSWVELWQVLQDARAEIERLREAIRRLAEQDATLSVCNGSVTVTLDATLTDAERADIEYWLAECERQCSAATDGGNEDLAERWQGRANRAAAMLKRTRGER